MRTMSTLSNCLIMAVISMEGRLLQLTVFIYTPTHETDNTKQGIDGLWRGS